MNIALIIAGGVGQRTHQDIPKQFLHIHDKPVIIYALEPFQNHPDIDQIVVVCLDGWHDALYAFCKQFNITKLTQVVRGGGSRHESVKNGILAIRGQMASPDDIVVIHDANRPLLSMDIIDACLESARTHGACVPVLPCADWVLYTEDGTCSGRSMDRNTLVFAQSPEAARYEKALWAYTNASRLEQGRISGLSSILIELGDSIRFVQGSAKMFKVTSREDLEIIKALIDHGSSSWYKP